MPDKGVQEHLEGFCTIPSLGASSGSSLTRIRSQMEPRWRRKKAAYMWLQTGTARHNIHRQPVLTRTEVSFATTLHC